MNRSVIVSIRRFVLKLLLSPVLAIMSLLLYPNIIIRMFSPQGKGYTVVNEKIAIVDLPRNAAGMEGSFYAPAYWFWPFFSLEGHAFATIEKIKELDEKGYDSIVVKGISMGGATAVVVMAELLKMQKLTNFKLKTPVKFYISNTFSKLETVILIHINNDGALYFAVLPLIFIAIPVAIASLFFTISSAITFLWVSVLIVILAVASVLKDNDGGGKYLDYICTMNNSTIIVLLTCIEVYCLLGTSFVYIPLVLCSITLDMFASYTVPMLCGILGCGLNIRQYFDYIINNRKCAGRDYNLTMRVSQVSEAYDSVLQKGILCNQDNADIFTDDRDHMYIPQSFKSI